MKRIERESVDGKVVILLEPESESDIVELERLITGGHVVELGSFAEAHQDRTSQRQSTPTRRRRARKLVPPTA